MKKIWAILLVAHFLFLVVSFAEKKTAYRFVIVPKDMNPWFYQVYEGAKLATKMLEESTGSKFVILMTVHPKRQMLQNKIRFLKI